MSYQKETKHVDDLTPLVGEGLASKTSSNQTSKRNMLLLVGTAIGLWMAVIGVPNLMNGKTSSRLRNMDILMPDGRHNISSDVLEAKWLPQTVDHFDDTNDATFDQKYFLFDKFWKGPGHPILFILGGEEPLDDLITPFVYYYMAKHFGAVSFGVEHRYFGDSFPIKDYTDEDLNKINSPQQAVEDFAQAAQWIRKELGCSFDKSSDLYCPVVTVAGSYPGFLSAMLRVMHPEIIDIAYATSAPIYLYGHEHANEVYYDYVTMVADAAVPGCAAAVKQGVVEFHDWAVASETGSMHQKAKEVKICAKGIPRYITESGSLELWWTEVNEIITSHFAEANMGYYPPGPATEFERACHIFMKEGDSMQEKIGNFLTMRSEWRAPGCFDMHSELPVGRKATISASDWSGMGDGINAYMWEHISCQLLPHLTQSEQSMFYPREWTLTWTAQHCKERFDMDIDPDRLRNYFGFEDLTGVEHLLFINHINDGWSATSVTVPPPFSGIEVINVVDGAHCSDFRGPGNTDTPAMNAAHEQIQATIEKWLNEIKVANKKK
jgi:hypothetical protein